MAGFPTKRMRRLRTSSPLREMLSEVVLRKEDLVAPIFVRESGGEAREIPSMPGQYQFSVDRGVQTAQRWYEKGLKAVLVFGIPETKDAVGSEAWNDSGPVQRFTGELKRQVPEMLVITDLCLCEYTDHGHCGALRGGSDGNRRVANDETLQLLARTAVSQARCGADIVAPSAMMDGQVSAVRAALDEHELEDTAVLSYSVKFASNLYGPFRDAGESAPQFGDRRDYQMDFRSPRQAILEAESDIAEGADMIMVKPAGAYLDVLSEVRRRFDVPLAAYHVSGEFAAIKAAAAKGWLDEREAATEIVTGIKRAGADVIITYFAEQLAEWL
ncbi:MAG: porphobilinogen synthase [Phycisphaerae bacterium]